MGQGNCPICVMDVIRVLERIVRPLGELGFGSMESSWEDHEASIAPVSATRPPLKNHFEDDDFITNPNYAPMAVLESGDFKPQGKDLKVLKRKENKDDSRQVSSRGGKAKVKSLSEREREYEKVKARIFREVDRPQSAQPVKGEGTAPSSQANPAKASRPASAGPGTGKGGPSAVGWEDGDMAKGPDGTRGFAGRGRGKGGAKSDGKKGPTEPKLVAVGGAGGKKTPRSGKGRGKGGNKDGKDGKEGNSKEGEGRRKGGRELYDPMAPKEPIQVTKQTSTVSVSSSVSTSSRPASVTSAGRVGSSTSGVKKAIEKNSRDEKDPDFDRSYDRYAPRAGQGETAPDDNAVGDEILVPQVPTNVFPYYKPDTYGQRDYERRDWDSRRDDPRDYDRSAYNPSTGPSARDLDSGWRNEDSSGGFGGYNDRAQYDSWGGQGRSGAGYGSGYGAYGYGSMAFGIGGDIWGAADREREEQERQEKERQRMKELNIKDTEEFPSLG